MSKCSAPAWHSLLFLYLLLAHTMPVAIAQSRPAVHGEISGEANVVISRLEFRPADSGLGTLLEGRVYFEKTAVYAWSLGAGDGIGADYRAPELLSVVEASQAGKPYLIVTCIAWQPGQSWLLLPELGGWRFPPIPLQVKVQSPAGLQPEVLPQAELPGFRSQLYLLLVVLALLLLLVLSMAVFLPGFSLRYRRVREARKALRQLEKGLQQLKALSAQAKQDSRAWCELDHLLRDYTQARLDSCDYRLWFKQQLMAEANSATVAATTTNQTFGNASDLFFLPALSASEVAALPARRFPSAVQAQLAALLQRCAIVCWSGCSDNGLSDAIGAVRHFVQQFNAGLSQSANPAEDSHSSTGKQKQPGKPDGVGRRPAKYPRKPSDATTNHTGVRS